MESVGKNIQAKKQKYIESVRKMAYKEIERRKKQKYIGKETRIYRECEEDGI